MSKKRFEIDTVGGIGVNDDGYYFFVFYTNHGILTYDAQFKRFKLNDIEISSSDYEFDNVYKKIIRYIDFFSSCAHKSRFNK